MRTKRANDLIQSTYGTNTQPAIFALVEFAAQNSGIEPRNYYDPANRLAGRRDTYLQGVSAYKSECRSITEDWRRFKLALATAADEGVSDLEVIAEAPHAFSGRLEWRCRQHHDPKTGEYAGRWDYCTGQYFPTEYRKAAATVLEAAIRRVRRNRAPETRSDIHTIRQLQALNEKNGGCWFEKGAMNFFGTSFESGIIRGKYFITSEQPPHGARGFTLRSFDAEGTISTVGECAGHKTKAEAIAAIPGRRALSLVRSRFSPELHAA